MKSRKKHRASARSQAKPNPPPPPDKLRRPWLTLTEVSVRVSVSRVTLWAWVRDGRFPEGTLLAGSRSQPRWHISTIEAWENAQRAAGGAA